MDARPVLGVPTLRPPLLVDLSAARSREAETSYRARVVTNTLFVHFAWGPTPTLAAGAVHFAWGPTPTLAAGAHSLSPPQGGCHVGSAGASRPSTSSGRGEPFEPRGPQAFSYARGAPVSSRRWGPTPGALGSGLSLARVLALSACGRCRARTLEASAVGGGAPTALEEDSLSSRGPQALFTICFVLDDDPDDDLDDDEFGDDEEGEDEEDEENDDEDPDTETWQVSSFEECPKGWLPLDFGV